MSMNNDQLWQLFEHALEAQTRHFDEKLSEIRTKVDPMHAVFTTGKTNAKAIAWTAGVISAVLVALSALKEVLSWFVRK